MASLARERRGDALQRQARAPRFGPVDGNVSAAIEPYGVEGGGQLERLDWRGVTDEGAAGVIDHDAVIERNANIVYGYADYPSRMRHFWNSFATACRKRYRRSPSIRAVKLTPVRAVKPAIQETPMEPNYSLVSKLHG